MASVSQSSSTKTSVTLYVSALNTASNYDTITITCNGITSGNLAKGGTGQSTSNSVTFGSLSCGGSYPASAYLHTTAGSTGSASGSGTTQACAPTPGTISSVSLSATGTTTMSGSWGTSTNASTYSYELWRSGGSVVASNYSYGSTSQTFSGLLSGTAYYLKVWGRNVDGVSGPPTNSSVVSTQSPPPSTPSLSLNSVNGKDISIQVSHSSNTTSIEFDYYWIAGYPDATKSVTGTSSTHTFTVPAYSTFYEVDCIAKNAYGNSGWSTKLGFTSGADPIPGTPTNLRKVSATLNTMLIAWNSVSGATGYSVEVYNKGTTTSPVFASYNQAGTSVTATGLVQNTEYDIKAYSQNANGNSAPTWIYLQKTEALPATPANLRYTSKDHSSINFAWDSVSEATSYSLELRIGADLVYQEYNITTLSKFATGLLSNTTYQAKLWAVNANGNSSPTFLNVTTDSGIPSIPTNFRVTSKDKTSINLAWDSMPQATSYAIEVYLQGTSTVVVSDYSISGTTRYFSGLTPGTTYSIKIWAIGPVGNSDGTFISTTTDALVPPNSPTNFRVSSQTSTAVTIAWNDVSNETSYSVEGYIKDTSTVVVSDYTMAANTISKYFSGLTEGGSYTFKLWATNSDGDSAPVYLSVVLDLDRPQNWSWSSLVSSAQVYTTNNILRANVVNASEWNLFTQRINNFRVYKKLANYTFTTVSIKGSLTDDIYNEARTAINAMNPPTAVPTQVVTGQKGVYSKLIALKDSLNSIQ